MFEGKKEKAYSCASCAKILSKTLKFFISFSTILPYIHQLILYNCCLSTSMQLHLNYFSYIRNPLVKSFIMIFYLYVHLTYSKRLKNKIVKYIVYVNNVVFLQMSCLVYWRNCPWRNTSPYLRNRRYSFFCVQNKSMKSVSLLRSD